MYSYLIEYYCPVCDSFIRSECMDTDEREKDGTIEYDYSELCERCESDIYGD